MSIPKNSSTNEVEAAAVDLVKMIKALPDSKLIAIENILTARQMDKILILCREVEEQCRKK